MNTSKHRKLKRHPIVRFIRGIFRLFRVLFRPKRTVRLELPHFEPIEEASFEMDRLVTVCEVLDGIKWQSPPPTVKKESTTNSRISKPQDVSRN